MRSGAPTSSIASCSASSPFNLRRTGLRPVPSGTPLASLLYMKWLCPILVLSLCLPAQAASRLKELVSIEGVRENQLIGYGLVVGLNGTGDKRQTLFSAQSL